MTTTTSVSAPPAALVALADPLRWQIVELLGREQLCVCHLVDELDVTQPLVSHHLKVLREAGLVVGERWRYWTYYSVVPDAIAELREHLRAAADVQSVRDRRPCC
jgi:ArsR family transcriptional regulator